MIAPVLETRGLTKEFPIARSLADTLRRRPAEVIHAVTKISMTIGAGETVGLIGESGSGKTTLGWLITRLYEATSGQVLFDGVDVTRLKGDKLRAWRKNVQIVFQDPVGSLDPRLRVWKIIAEPLQAQPPVGPPRGSERRAKKGKPLTRAQLRARVAEILPTVGLPADCLDQYPHEFSGGGRQRLSLARALILHPRLVVLDEPTSALDVAVQAQILNRLVQLQKDSGYAYLLITHNVGAVRYVADRVAVMYLGQFVEVGPTRRVLERPTHPYTKALLAALPVADVSRRRTYYRVTGEIPTLVRPPPGCRFAPRCPFVIDRCRVEEPLLRPNPADPTTSVACHRAEEIGDVPPETLRGDRLAT
jgi:peptide/nickel transport system ATP-binding protein